MGEKRGGVTPLAAEENAGGRPARKKTKADPAECCQDCMRNNKE
jgi:hypothetical protein